MIPPPPFFTVGWTLSSINSSPAILLTYTLPSLRCKRNLDSSLKMTWDHCSAVQFLWVRANSRRAFLCRDVRRGFFLGLRPMCPASLSLLRVVEVDTLTPCSSLHLCLYLWRSLIAIRHAFSNHGSIFAPRCLSLSSWNLEVFHTSCRFLFFPKYHIHFFGYSLCGQQSPVANSLPQTMPTPFPYL